MTQYLYLLTVQTTFPEMELKRVKDEICRLFDCTDVEVSGATDFVVYTPLGPGRVQDAVQELSRKFGAEFKAGMKMQ
jgi:hypothetical protein